MATYSFTKVSDGKYEIKVKSGHTLSGIASAYNSQYGKKITYQNLASWNKISNPNKIYVGQTIKCYSSSGGSGGSSSSTKAPTNVAVVTHFGANAQNQNELIVEWTWAKEKDTESYEIEWGYANGSGLWLGKTLSSNSVDEDNRAIARQTTYSIPADATRVRFRVKPIAKKKKDSKGKETAKFTASWTAFKYWDKGAAPDAPDIPSVEINGSKVKATVRYDPVNLDGITHVQFKIQKNDDPKQTVTPAMVALVGGVASYEHSGANDSKYKCAARAYIKSRDVYSEWSNWSANHSTKPVAPKEITTIRAESPTSVYLAWTKVDTATKYDIEYIEDKRYFDNSGMAKSQPVEKDENTQDPLPNSYLITDIESGKEYFFRVRAWNDTIASSWSGIKSVVVGMKPSAPTTWSSSSKVIEEDGKNTTLYWMHNSKDESRQTSAKLELRGIPGTQVNEPVTVILGDDIVDTDYVYYEPKVVEKHESEPTYECTLKTLNFTNGASIEWRMCTAGVLNEGENKPVYGPWSTPRTIDVYSTPDLSLSMPELNEGVLNSFPVYIHAKASNDSVQWPTSYHVSITANEGYETTDPFGNFKMVNAGDEVYSVYANPNVAGNVAVGLLPSNITLENGMTYIVKCIASMSSGLTVEASTTFTVDWTVAVCEPNAEIGVDKENLTASIRPYCETIVNENYQVSCSDCVKGSLITNATLTEKIKNEGAIVAGCSTKTGEQLFLHTELDANGLVKSTYYTEISGSYYTVQLGSTYVCEPNLVDIFYGNNVIKTSGKNTVFVRTTAYVRDNYQIGLDDELKERLVESGIVTVDNHVVWTDPNSTNLYAIIDNCYYPINTQDTEVYVGMDDEGKYTLYCTIDKREAIEDVWLSVYRREFDGRFTEIATNLDAASRTTVTDPHPALDYARYRIVAADKTTGHIEYFDCPAYPVGGIAAVLQWDEQATNFDALEDVAPVDPALSGSMLKLPYNIDVSDNTKPEVTLVEYIGRSHPVSYYGTQLGSSSSWNMVIDKNDIETIYALRRLSRWLGDVYVREPSGTGYWAQVTVSFSQNHCEVTIPVSLSITRVEGGA